MKSTIRKMSRWSLSVMGLMMIGSMLTACAHESKDMASTDGTSEEAQVRKNEQMVQRLDHPPFAIRGPSSLPQ